MSSRPSNEAAERTSASGQFKKLPLEFRERQHELTGVKLGIWICYRLHENAETGVACVSLCTLAKKIGVKDIRWLREQRKEMVSDGWLLRCGSKPGTHGGQPVPLFRTEIPPATDDSQGARNSTVEKVNGRETSVLKGGENHLPNGGENPPCNRSIVIEEKKESASRPEAPLAFTGLHLKITQRQDKALRDAFAFVDVSAEYRKMDSWIENNPGRRPKNCGRFAQNWLSRTKEAETPQPAVESRKELERRRSELTPKDLALYARHGIRP